MSVLRNKSITALRGIAQSYGVKDIFQKDATHLIQAIELKQQEMRPADKVEIPKPAYDARLMNRPPSKKSSVGDLETLLHPYIVRGLKISYDQERWYMSLGAKTDEGTLRMPLHHVLKCAERLFL